MSDLIDMIAEDRAKLSGEREQNRTRFPFVTACVDALTPQFGPVRVIFAEEGAHRAGKEPT